MFNLNDKWGSYTVTGIKTIVHGEFFPNTDIKAIVSLKGKRGATANAYIFQSGKIGQLMKGADCFEGVSILDGRI